MQSVKLIVKNNGHNISVRYPDARHTLFIESVFITEICKNHEAFEVIINYIARLPAGKAPEEFGFKDASTRSLTPKSKIIPN